jgi:hypothetical protein
MTDAEEAQVALEETDRRLRRVVRRLEDGPDPTSAEFQKELRAARRQLKINRDLLGVSPRSTEPAEGKAGAPDPQPPETTAESERATSAFRRFLRRD